MHSRYIGPPSPQALILAETPGFCYYWVGGGPFTHHKRLCSASTRRAGSPFAFLTCSLGPALLCGSWCLFSISLTMCAAFICIFHLVVTVPVSSQVWWFQTLVVALPDESPWPSGVYRTVSPLSWAIWKVIILVKALPGFQAFLSFFCWGMSISLGTL